MSVHSFDVESIACQDCGASQAPARFAEVCPLCRGSLFKVEIERSASGINGDNFLDVLVSGSVGGGTVGSFVDIAMDDSEGSGLLFRTHCILSCGGVSGGELVGFVRASIEERRQMYVLWKRRDIESHLVEGQRLCERCRVLFKVYDNEWNRAGLCSKSCHAAFLKSLEKGR
jgi:hypothetical protein